MDLEKDNTDRTSKIRIEPRCSTSLSLQKKKKRGQGRMCYVHAKSLQSCPTLSHHMDCSLPGSSVHEISKHEYWSALPCPLPGDLHNPGIKQCLLHLSPALQVDSLHLSHWEAQRSYTCSQTELRLKLNVTKEPR